jgi:hypothetical protein
MVRKLADHERPHVLADAGLPEDRGASITTPDRHRDADHERRQHDECRSSADPVEHALDDPAEPGELGMIHVQ